jgi:hypothetical protein
MRCSITRIFKVRAEVFARIAAVKRFDAFTASPLSNHPAERQPAESKRPDSEDIRQCQGISPQHANRVLTGSYIRCSVPTDVVTKNAKMGL